ncbi:hypothetical protein [Salinispora arenicola]|uniref:hypothetical protein n=1 Tax=Salinispora arenicola TaxID=168697 RepID=UPI0003A3858B|nr:hypothetical protein [Salinispora arenicola]
MGWADGDPLGVRIRAAFGADPHADPATWSWTDLTAYWRASDPIELEWGRQSSASRPESSTCALTLRNSDGRFTVGHAMSPYWPYVRTWTPVSVDVDLGDGAGWRNRHSGHVRNWPVTWPGRSGKLAVARIESVGVLGRLGRGSPPGRSPMNRSILAAAGNGLLAYWPCEDEADATQAASGIRGVAPMRADGSVEFAAGGVDITVGGTQRYGTKPLPLLTDGGSLSGRAPAGTSSPVAWTLEAFWQTGNPTEQVVLMRWTTPTGPFVRWDYVDSYNDVYGTYLVAYTASGSPTVVWSVPTRYVGPFNLRISAVQNGGSIDVTVMVGLQTIGSVTVTGTLARIDTIALNPDQHVISPGALDFVVGHLRVWDSATSPLTYSRVDAHPGEAAHLRLARLCAEDGVALSTPTVPDEGATAMGVQPDGTPLDLYQQCEQVDLGIIYESGFGLAYLPRWSRYNAPPALTIDAANRQLGGNLRPAADDQRLRNHWTVTRIGGSSAVAADEESIAQRGQIPSSPRLNLTSDGQLQHHANWRLWMYGQAGTRYRLTVPLHTRAGRGLTADWVACQPGSRVQVVNAPDAATTDTIDQTLVHARETITGRRRWTVELATEPAGRWDVAVVDGPQRVAADGSTIAAVSESAMTMTMTSTAANRPWTTDPADFPLDLRIGGERVTATGITGTGLTQTVTLSARSVNGVSRAWPDGTEVQVWAPAVVPL